MSLEQNYINNEPPRRFLKKGEGLKRFAAYKPPLPTTTKKPIERRQTFVRFRLDQNKLKTNPVAHFIPPEILNDDSINLSTEIPKIAPPKIIHTPIRPNRHALGTLTNESHLFTDTKIDRNIDSLYKKIEEKKVSLDGGQEDQHDCHEGSFTVFVEEQSSQHEVRRAHDLSKPTAGSAILALGRQIEQMEATLNELQEKLKNCECCNSVQQPKETARRRPTTRAASRAAKSRTNDADRKQNGPSAPADNEYPIRKVVNSLRDDMVQLKAKFKVIDLRN